VTLPAADAADQIEDLLDQTALTHEPIEIVGTRTVGVLLSDADWRSIQETLHLLSVPGMRESILAGAVEPADGCAKDPGW